MTLRVKSRRLIRLFGGSSRGVARDVITRLPRYRRGELDDILIVASKRSGSTWLMEVLASEPRVIFVNEPFHPDSTARSGLPVETGGAIVRVPPGSEQQFRHHLTDHRAARIRGPYNPFGRHYHLFPNRRVVKVINGTTFADWVDDQQLGFIPVYLIRHPIPSALSMMMRSGGPPEIGHYLRHEEFRARCLDDPLVERIESIMSGDSPLLQWVVDWCLENIVPWRAVTIEQRDWLMVTYEELVRNPTDTIEWLADRLGLEHPDRMLKHIHVPSVSTDLRRYQTVTTVPPAHRVDEWRANVNEDDERQVFEIVQAFGIDAYRLGSGMPRDQFLHFPPDRA